ncbi:hypothetical protein EVC02_055 [Rhizobium phage RHph_N17]|nr:hypothetical protein EVC02_055 [Rhizobium phage RHph_N17]
MIDERTERMTKAKRGEAWRGKPGVRFVNGEQMKLSEAFPQHAPRLTTSRLFLYVKPGDLTPFAAFSRTDSGWADGDLCFATALQAAKWAVEYLLPQTRRRVGNEHGRR